MDDICETLGRASLKITEYDVPTVRQLIHAIRVMSEDSLLIIFKGKFEINQIKNRGQQPLSSVFNTRVYFATYIVIDFTFSRSTTATKS